MRSDWIWLGACHWRGTGHFSWMTSRRLAFGVGFLLTAFSAFGQTGSPAKESTSETGLSESPTPTPIATPVVFSSQTLADLKRLQQAALNSDYAYRQVAHLADNIGPRLSGSAQAAKAVEYVAGELKAIGCENRKRAEAFFPEHLPYYWFCHCGKDRFTRLGHPPAHRYLPLPLRDSIPRRP